MSLFANREPNALDPQAIAEATGDQPAAMPAPEPGSPAATRPVATRAEPATAPAEEEGVTIMRRDDDGSIEEISMVIERVREYNYNQHRFYMENGQVWRQVDTERVRLNRNSENTAVIRRAPLGRLEVGEVPRRQRALRGVEDEGQGSHGPAMVPLPAAVVRSRGAAATTSMSARQMAGRSDAL